MKSNVGRIDRALRVCLGIVLIGLPFISGAAMFNSTGVTLISVVAGFVMLGTSAMKFCPLYRILGIQTCKV